MIKQFLMHFPNDEITRKNHLVLICQITVCHGSDLMYIQIQNKGLKKKSILEHDC